MSSRFFTKRHIASKRRCRKSRPKTFKTEEAAKKYGEGKGIKNYELVNLRNPDSSKKKIKLVVKF